MISSVSSEALAWLIAQPRPVKAISATTPSRIPELHRDPVAAQGVGALEARRGCVEHPEVMRPAVVLKDVVAVEVVHLVRECSGSSPGFNSERSDQD